jgi:signal transduction histidine kinase
LKPKLTAVLLLIVLTPLAIVGWLGAKLVQDEQAMVRQRVEELTVGQLQAIDAAVATALDSYQQELLREMRPIAAGREEWRRRSRVSALATQFYVLDEAGQLQFPPVGSPQDLSVTEREALQRTASIWDGGDLLASAEESAATAESGWKAWYWGNGLQMMLWTREGQRIGAAEVNRTRLLADLVAALPETDAMAPQLRDGRIQLLDSTGALLYQWGAVPEGEALERVARIPLRAPLSAWSLEYMAAGGGTPGGVGTGGMLLTVVPSLIALALAVTGLAVYFYREQSREAREAAQRVSFVNQVSHELKTPLTNIRMYAELLEKETDENNAKLQRYLGVIVAESQRLSRLIANVLTFSRGQRQSLQLHLLGAVPDEVIRTVMEQFGPSLEARGIAVELDLAAERECLLDADVLGQIVGNLVSNVEKYGAAGKWMRVASRQSEEELLVTVEDRGPGVPVGERERIFAAFYRIHNSLTEGVSGTGIGLSIARELARLHGGDVVLEEDKQEGARFRVTLRCGRNKADNRAEEERG